MYFVRCMAPVHVRDRKTQRIQVVQKDMYAYESQKCDLYAVRIVRYGLRSDFSKGAQEAPSNVEASVRLYSDRLCRACQRQVHSSHERRQA